MTKDITFSFRKKQYAMTAPDKVADVTNATLNTYRATRTFIRRSFKICLYSGIASFGLQMLPDQLMTKSLNEHMAEQGMGEDLQKYFNAKNIRVYSRSNPLYILDGAGDAARIENEEAARSARKTNGEKIVDDTILTPLRYPSILWKHFTTAIFPHPLDAYALSSGVPLESRECYIRPPGKINIADYINTFTGLDAENYTFKNDPATLERLLYKYVMLHEARHCDQNKDIDTGSLNETDSDLFAINILMKTEKDTAAVTELREILMYVRLYHGIAGDNAHMSSFGIEREGQTPMQSLQDVGGTIALSDLLSTAVRMNRDSFNKDTQWNEKYYHISRHMLDKGMFKNQPDLEKTAKAFVDSIDYFEKSAVDKKIINTPHKDIKIDMGYLNKAYYPPVGKSAVKSGFRA